MLLKNSVYGNTLTCTIYGSKEEKQKIEILTNTSTTDSVCCSWLTVVSLGESISSEGTSATGGVKKLYLIYKIH
mgnify:CR=1 FL=1